MVHTKKRHAYMRLESSWEIAQPGVGQAVVDCRKRQHPYIGGNIHQVGANANTGQVKTNLTWRQPNNRETMSLQQSEDNKDHPTIQTGPDLIEIQPQF